MTDRTRFQGINSDNGTEIGFTHDKLQQVQSQMDSTTEIKQTDDINPMYGEEQITPIEMTQDDEEMQASEQVATQASTLDRVEWSVVYFNAELAKKEKEKKPKKKSRSIILKNEKKLSETRTTVENSSTSIGTASEGNRKAMVEEPAQKSIVETESSKQPKPLKVKFKFEI